MTAAIYNFTIEQGATFQRDFVYQDAQNNPINLTGYSARMQVRQKKDSDQIFIDATTQNGKLVVTPLTGKVSLNLSASETSALKFESAVYDLELEANGVVTRLLEGTINLSKQVTR